MGLRPTRNQKETKRKGQYIYYADLKRLQKSFKVKIDEMHLRDRSLLHRNTAGYYRFAHRTFREYLSAVALMERYPSGVGLVAELGDRLRQPGWRQVALMVLEGFQRAAEDQAGPTDSGVAGVADPGTPTVGARILGDLLALPERTVDVLRLVVAMGFEYLDVDASRVDRDAWDRLRFFASVSCYSLSSTAAALCAMNPAFAPWERAEWARYALERMAIGLSMRACQSVLNDPRSKEAGTRSLIGIPADKPDLRGWSAGRLALASAMSLPGHLYVDWVLEALVERAIGRLCREDLLLLLAQDETRGLVLEVMRSRIQCHDDPRRNGWTIQQNYAKECLSLLRESNVQAPDLFAALILQSVERWHEGYSQAKQKVVALIEDQESRPLALQGLRFLIPNTGVHLGWAAAELLLEYGDEGPPLWRP